jgi:very-short-patch-repair endonuclease
VAALRRLLLMQDNVISRAEALDCGLTDRQLRYRIRPGGPWQRLLPGVYLAVTGTPTRQQLDIAALRYAGSGSALTGLAALRRHGARVPDRGIVTVLIHRRRTREDRSFVRVWPTTRMPEFVCGDGPVRFTMAARAIADAARELDSFRDFRAVLADAVQQRHCKIEMLSRELAQVPMRHSGWLRCALAEVADGVRSVAEGDLRDLIIRAQLPRPMFNARLFAGRTFLAIADAWWPRAGVAVEVDSREWHLSPEDWERTQARHTRMSACGIIVQHFTPHRIRTDPAQVVTEISSALRAGQQRPALAVRALPATG